MKANKIIEVEYCDDCPFNLKCKAWQKLTRKQVVSLTLGVSVKPFILKGCHLTDGPDLQEYLTS